MLCIYVGFFNPAIPTQILASSRNPDGYIRVPYPMHNFDPKSRAFFALKSRILTSTGDPPHYPHVISLLLG